MTPRRSGPLFHSTEPDVYLIDTSAWINIDERSDSESAWALVLGLLKRGRVVTCARVIGELRDNPMYERYLKKYEQALLSGDRASTDPDYLACLGRVTLAHPAMAKARLWKEPADTYVVALAELEGYVVVVDETKDHRPNRKIPGVCDHRGIRWMSSAAFLRIAAKELEQPEE